MTTRPLTSPPRAGAQPLDTGVAAHAAQIAAWRSMSSERRLRLVDDLSCDVDALARAGIEAAHPGLSDHGVRWHLAARRFGPALACAAFGPEPSSDPTPTGR